MTDGPGEWGELAEWMDEKVVLGSGLAAEQAIAGLRAILGRLNGARSAAGWECAGCHALASLGAAGMIAHGRERGLSGEAAIAEARLTAGQLIEEYESTPWEGSAKPREAMRELSAGLLARRLVLSSLQGKRAVQVGAVELGPLLGALVEMAAAQQVQLGIAAGCEPGEAAVAWAASSVGQAADTLELAMLDEGVIPPPPLLPAPGEIP